MISAATTPSSLIIASSLSANVISSFREVNTQVERIDAISRQFVVDVDYNTLSPLFSGLRVSFQKLTEETKLARESLKATQERLTNEVAAIAKKKAELETQYDATKAEYDGINSSISSLKEKCQSLESERTELKEKIKDIEKLREDVKSKRWNTLRDLLPLHGLAGGLMVDKSLKSGLLRSIPGYSVVKGIKSITSKEYGKLGSDLWELEKKLNGTVEDIANKEKELATKKTELDSKKAALAKEEKEFESKSKELKDHLIKIDNHSSAYLAVGQLVNSYSLLDSSIVSIARRCERKLTIQSDITAFITSYDQFKRNHGKLLLAS